MSRRKSRIGYIKPSKVLKLRLSLSESQNHNCAYCGFPMFDYRIDSILDFMKIYNLPYRLCKNEFSLTIDHVDATGKNSIENFVASHMYCNSIKGQTDADEYFETVRTQITAGNHFVYKIFNNSQNKLMNGTVVSTRGLTLSTKKFKCIEQKRASIENSKNNKDKYFYFFTQTRLIKNSVLSYLTS